MTSGVTALPNPMEMMMESGQPVRGFKGKLIRLVFGKGREGGFSTPLLFEHLDTEFIDTISPYTNGTQYVVDIPWSEKGTARWEALCESAKATLKLDQDGRLPMGELKGKILEWKWTEGHPTRVQNEEGTWVAGTMEAWVIVGIDSNRHPDFPLEVAGGSNGGTAVTETPSQPVDIDPSILEGVQVTPYEYALALSYGHSNAQWQNLALNHPLIKGDKEFFDRLVAEGVGIFSEEARVKYENDVFVAVDIDEGLSW